MTEDTRLMASLKKVKNIRQYVFSGRTASDLVPEIRKHKDLGVNIVNFISFLIGVSLMWIIKIVLGA